jgi:hypothetical protein
MSISIPTPKPSMDFVSYIAFCIVTFCRARKQTGPDCIINGLLENVNRVHEQKIKSATANVTSVPWADPDLDEMLQEVLQQNEAPKPEPKPEPKSEPKPVNYKIRPVTWNDKGPIVDSRLIIDLSRQLFDHGDLTEWEERFLGEEEGKLKNALDYPQTFFTFHSGGIFERLCYRAGLECPFHIDPGQTTPPDDRDA